MQRFKNYVLATAGLVILVGVVSIVSVKAARGGAPLGSTPVRDVESGARDPFETNNSGFLQDGQTGNKFSFGTVPAGKRLVIEYISAEARLGSNQRPRLEIITVRNIGGTPTARRHYIAFGQVNLVEGVDTVASQTVRIYADPGTEVAAEYLRDGVTSGTSSCFVTISGHFVTL
jgi:hypothetical protein